MSSSLTTCSSTAEDEFSSDVFGQGGNAEVNDGGTTSVSGGNSRKTMIGDGGMKRKMTELFILTVVNITVTVALINFIAPNENARINADELESLKKFVGKMEQQRGNNDGQQTEFCAKMDTEKDMVKAIETKLNELVEQQKKEAIFIGVLKDRFGKEREMPTNEAGEEKLSQLQNDQKKLLKKSSSKWPSFQQLIELSFCFLLALIKPILCVFLFPLLMAFILQYVGDGASTGGGDENIVHWILNIMLNLYMTNILGDTLGYVPGIIYAIWFHRDVRGLTAFALHKYKEQQGHRLPESPTALEHFYEHVKERMGDAIENFKGEEIA
ncbi:hypothetical protein niasHT_025140 [Heterodera trifolii]|uniref:Uncharacterized protein n=1 Tax=Heterodera trifolii TaxID=157864 RepID=A0ABD2K1E1_9BILA